jgi:hypothetical protein
LSLKKRSASFSDTKAPKYVIKITPLFFVYWEMDPGTTAEKRPIEPQRKVLTAV